MKKTLSLILAAALAISLAACGGGSGGSSTSGSGNRDAASTDTSSGGMTKEEMLEQAVERTAVDIASDTGENIARATQEYCGKTFLMKGRIGKINTDHITIETGTVRFKVYLPVDDIVNLENGQDVTIVGKTGAEIKEEPLGPGIPQNVYVYEVSPAYFVTDRYEYTGIPKSENDSFPGAWNVEFPDSYNPEYLRLVYFDDSVDVSQYEGKEITFSAKYSESRHFYDAVIVE